jgi:hypothetical protein
MPGRYDYSQRLDTPASGLDCEPVASMMIYARKFAVMRAKLAPKNGRKQPAKPATLKFVRTKPPDFASQMMVDQFRIKLPR